MQKNNFSLLFLIYKKKAYLTEYGILLNIYIISGFIALKPQSHSTKLTINILFSQLTNNPAYVYLMLLFSNLIANILWHR